MRDGEVVGYCLAAAGERWYLPVRHPEDNVDNPDMLLEKLRHELKSFSGTLVGHNLLYDLGWASTDALSAPKATLYDTGFAAALLDEGRFSYSLDSLAKTYQLPAKDETLLREAAAAYGVDPKSGLHALPARFVAAYGAHDAWLPIEIFGLQLQELISWKLLPWLQREHELIPLLLAMRGRGVRVDVDGAERLQAELYQKRDARLEAIRLELNRPIDVWEAKDLAVAFDAAGVNVPRTPLGRPSVTAPWLESLNLPLARWIVEARRYDKAGRDFAGSMILGHQVNGRVYPQFNPLRSDEGGTITGRFSSNGPNLQQVPARDPEIGPAIRNLFLPEVGETWYAIDYKAQEPRLTVHFANLPDPATGRDAGFPGAEAAVVRYNNDPDTDYHQMVAEMAGIKRKQAKTINLGIPYGMRALKLCRELGLPTEFIEVRDRETGEQVVIEVAGADGKSFLSRYHEAVPFVQGLFDACDTKATERGWVRSLGGRILRFNLWEPAKKSYRTFNPPLPHAEAAARYGEIKRANTYKAMNKLIQGSAADMIKLAMLDLHREGLVPLVSIHDELGFSFASEAEARRAATLMCEAVKLAVPVLVDVESGPTWGQAKPFVLEEA